ncbi:MAG TPA: formate/nitrite transporter family protein, partial [Candidatus Dormibacteraeota bacterium]|nr:formate/nitrite transporter family protein [Candidatus Dormibacteraeota bacterium]
MAAKVEEVGVSKAHLSAISTLVLAMLAGGFIASGPMFYTLASAGSDLHVGMTRLLGGLAFSLRL